MSSRNKKMAQAGKVFRNGKYVTLQEAAEIKDSRNFHPRKLLCLICGNSYPESRCRRHIKDCWGITIKDTEPIPSCPPDEILLKSKLVAEGIIVIKKKEETKA